MPCRARLLAAAVALLALVAGAASAGGAPLPDLGPAPAFRLPTQDGAPLALADLKGKVVVVAFIYTECKDVCLAETAKMVQVQKQLGRDFGRRVHFVSITLDPETDTGPALATYARRFGAQLSGWSFLTGTPEQIRETAERYGVAFRKAGEGEVEHNTLASVIDRQGRLRVQYLGTAFDPGELLADLRALLQEGGSR